MAQSKNESNQDTTKAKASGGTTLRGVLDFYGYSFLVSMDRQAWTKEWFDKGWGQDGYWAARNILTVKLLRFPVHPQDQQTKGRAFVECDLQDVLKKGFVGQIALTGWFDDLTMHFRGRALGQSAEGGVPWFPWMHHMYMPWQEVDIRFDDQGAHVRMDWKMEKEAVTGVWNKVGKAWSDKELRFGLFRMDSLPSKDQQPSDPKKTFTAMTYSRNMLSSYTLRMDECTGNPSKFRCVMEQRPLSATVSSLYRDPPYQNEGKGAWFTFIGTVGRLMLEFKKQADDSYEAKALKSWCGGMSPCPFIVSEDFKAFFKPKRVLLQQTDPGLKTPATFYLYGLFDPGMEKGLDVNDDGWSTEGKRSAIVISPKHDPYSADDGSQPMCPCNENVVPAGSQPTGLESCRAATAKVHEQGIEIIALKASVAKLAEEVAGKDVVSTKHKKVVRLTPGEAVVIQSDFT